MNLRQKTLLLTTLPLLGLLVILYGSFSAILQRSYGRLEQQDAQKNLQRVNEVLAGDLILLPNPARHNEHFGSRSELLLWNLEK